MVALPRQITTPAMSADPPPPYTPARDSASEARIRLFQQQVREVSSFIRASTRLHEAPVTEVRLAPSATRPSSTQPRASYIAAPNNARPATNTTQSATAALSLSGERQRQAQSQTQAGVTVLVKAGTTIRGSNNVVCLSGLRESFDALSSALKQAQPSQLNKAPIVLDMTIDINGDDNHITHRDPGLAFKSKPAQACHITPPDRQSNINHGNRDWNSVSQGPSTAASDSARAVGLSSSPSSTGIVNRKRSASCSEVCSGQGESRARSMKSRRSA